MKICKFHDLVDLVLQTFAKINSKQQVYVVYSPHIVPQDEALLHCAYVETRDEYLEERAETEGTAAYMIMQTGVDDLEAEGYIVVLDPHVPPIMLAKDLIDGLVAVILGDSVINTKRIRFKKARKEFLDILSALINDQHKKMKKLGLDTVQLDTSLLYMSDEFPFDE